MKTIIIIALLFGLSSGFTSTKDCPCLPAEQNEATHFGGNELVTIIEEKTFKTVEGVVRDVNGEPLKGVLLEVFDKPEWIAQGSVKPPSNQTRIAACKTGEDGRFCFSGIPAGRYEVRSSIDSGWNPLYVYVKVNPNKRQSKKGLEIVMQVGT